MYGLTDPAAIADEARRHWAAAPAPALRAHLAALRAIFAQLPAVCQRDAWGAKQIRHYDAIERAIAILEGR